MSRLHLDNSIFTDAHCHVDLFPDPIALARQRSKARIPTIAVTNAPSVFFYTKELSINNPFIIPAVGLHPELVHSHGGELEQLISLIDNVSVVGEIGLDFTEINSSIRLAQRKVFHRILAECAEKGNRVLSIHSRRAAAETISMIGPHYPGSIVLHWFTGTIPEARSAVSNGYFFSINCAMAKSERGKRLLAEIPPNQVLTETDAPFMDCCSNSSLGAHAIGELSRLWNQSATEVANIIHRNYCSIFPTIDLECN